MTDGEIRPFNDDVVMQLEINGRGRRVTVTREALEDFLSLPPNEAAKLTAEQRCNQVRKYMPTVITAVHRKLRVSHASAGAIVLFAGDL